MNAKVHLHENGINQECSTSPPLKGKCNAHSINVLLSASEMSGQARRSLFADCPVDEQHCSTVTQYQTVLQGLYDMSKWFAGAAGCRMFEPDLTGRKHIMGVCTMMRCLSCSECHANSMAAYIYFQA